MKKVSIIIPTYNGQKTIQETLQSVFLQTYQNYEIIVVDDNSTDATIDLIKSNFPSVKVIQQKNQGTLAARQAGIDTARGDYIALLDQDDLWFQETLQKNIDVLEKNLDIGLVLANMKAIDNGGNPFGFNVVPDEKCYPPSWEELLLFHPIANSVALFRRQLVNKIGGLDKNFKFSGALGDTDTFCRMAEITKIYFVNECLGYYRWSETRPGRLQSFLENLKIYTKKYWQHPNMTTNVELRGRFTTTCCAYGIHIHRLLLKQYNDEISLPTLENLNEHTKHMQNLFGITYQSQIGLRPLDLTLFNLKKTSIRTLLFIYLLRKDLQETFSSVFTGSLDELEMWASGVATQKYTDGDFISLQKYADDFSSRTAKLSPFKKWRVFRIFMATKKLQIRHNLVAIIHRVLPEGTYRRHFFYPIILGAKVLLLEGMKSFIKKAGNYMLRKVRTAIDAVQMRASYIKDFLVFKLNLQKELIFPVTSQPDIVIFVNLKENQHHNHNCLESILSFTKVPYRVYATAYNTNSPALKRIKNIVLFENPNKTANAVELYKKNRQNIVGCKYFLFLDGSCLVTDEYLQSLLSLLETNQCNIASGKIVDTYNRIILHAGSTISPDDTIKIFGLGQDVDKPEYSHVRAIDIPAEECMLLSTKTLDKICDDSPDQDFSFINILQNKSYKILFQPRSIIKYQAPEKFKNFVSITTNAPNALKILVLDDYIPAIRYGSGFPRLYEMLSCLSDLGYFVTFFPVGNPVKVQPETGKLQQKGVEVFLEKYANFQEFMRDRCNQYDIVLISRPHVFEKFYTAIKENFSNSTIVYDAEALFYTREQAKAKIMGQLGNKELENLAKQEMYLLEKADIAISVSEGEKETMLRQSSQKNIEVWGHIQDVQESTPPLRFNERNGILFLGSFFAGPGSPNEDAALYFANQIFPEILKIIDCELFIVGADPTDAVKALASEKIKVTGYVERLENYFDKCRVNVVPTRFAAGIPLKLLQTMSFGIPSVTSELIAKQLVLSDGKEVLIAHNNTEFVQKIIMLYSDETLWATLSQNSREFVLNNFSRTNMMNKLKTIIEKSRILKGKNYPISQSTTIQTS
jgi:glycosyltransferase involved in cell wall biosynthesis